MFNTITNLSKAVAGILVSPVALVADFCCLPGTAYNDKHPFGNTDKVLAAAGKCLEEALKPKSES